MREMALIIREYCRRPSQPKPQKLTLEDVIVLLQKELNQMSAALDRLTQEVHDMTDITEGALALIAGLADQIRNAVDDSAALTTLADDLDAARLKLADAISKNTPAAPAPVVAPAPAPVVDPTPAPVVDPAPVANTDPAPVAVDPTPVEAAPAPVADPAPAAPVDAPAPVAADPAPVANTDPAAPAAQ